MIDGKYQQRVTLELFRRSASGWRRIAQLPDCDDNLSEIIKSKYTRPHYNVRLVTEIF